MYHNCPFIYGRKFVNTVISQVIDSKQPGKVANTVHRDSHLSLCLFFLVCTCAFTYQFFMASNRCLHSFKTAIHLINCQQRLCTLYVWHKNKNGDESWADLKTCTSSDTVIKRKTYWFKAYKPNTVILSTGNNSLWL